MIEDATPAPPASILEIFRTYFQVKNAWRNVRRTREEYAKLRQMIGTVVEYNEKCAIELRELREERDELVKALGQFKVVDPNAKCPGCGATDGAIETKQDVSSQTAYVEHTCKVCKCHWPEAPVYKDLARMWAAPELPARR